MPSPVQTFTHNNVKITHDSANVHKITVGTVDFETLVNFFNESNYNVVRMVFIPPELEQICFQIFDCVKEMHNQNFILLATATSNFVFERFTILWNYYLTHERYMMGTKLWQHVCRFVWKWEEQNNSKIHKGTPYFFLGGNQLMQGNVDNAFLFIYNAMEEDKRYVTQIGAPDAYKRMPAYMFSSLVDNPNNYLYPYIKDAKEKVEDFIQKHNALLSKTLSYSYVDGKFFSSSDLEVVKFSFVYTMLVMKNHDNIDHENLRNNDFSKLRNLDIVFNLCLIIDEIMKEKTNKRQISGSVIQICHDNLNENDALNIFKSLNFENDFENAVTKCLNLNYNYNSRRVNNDVMVLILAWGLRNFGGHKIEARQIFVDEYQNIIDQLMSALFVTLEKLY